jgi:hypothetical protein
MGKHLLVAALLAVLPAEATTLLAQDLAELSQSADAIVRGTVRELESRWTGDRMRIVTQVEVEVAEALKGAPGASVTIVQPGGVVGDIGQKVSGLASFERGEEVVLFLERRPGGIFLVSGMAQGKFRVERSSDGRALFAIPEREIEALLLDPLTRLPVPPRVGPIALEELRERIRENLRRPPPPRPRPLERAPR